MMNRVSLPFALPTCSQAHANVSKVHKSSYKIIREHCFHVENYVTTTHVIVLRYMTGLHKYKQQSCIGLQNDSMTREIYTVDAKQIFRINCIFSITITKSALYNQLKIHRLIGNTPVFTNILEGNYRQLCPFDRHHGSQHYTSQMTYWLTIGRSIDAWQACKSKQFTLFISFICRPRTAGSWLSRPNWVITKPGRNSCYDKIDAKRQSTSRQNRTIDVQYMASVTVLQMSAAHWT